MSITRVRPAIQADLSSIATYIATMNTSPEHRCLHCDEDVMSVNHSIQQLPQPFEQAFIVAEQNDNLVGLIGCDSSAEQHRGWLWGPFVSIKPWEEIVGQLFEYLMQNLPTEVHQLDNFLDQQNKRGIDALERQGFKLHGITHIYEAIRPDKFHLRATLLTDLNDADLDAFRELHDTIFPGTYKDAARIIAERDADHRIFAYSRDGELLGYLYATPSDVEGAGYIHYVGVREDARGQGIGHHLVESAQQWMFEERGFTKISLTVADTHEKARALYERTGFRLLYTGVGQRKQW